MKLKYPANYECPVINQQALDSLKRNAIHLVPRDIESFFFYNKIDASKYLHNRHLTNATQSQQYIMDLVDKKFEHLKDNIYKLGISP
jgi:hypothetical protein